MPTVKFNPLDPDSIDKAVTKVKSYRKKVEDLPDKLVHRLTLDGVQTAKEMAMYMNAYDSGELVNGIVPEFRNGSGYIVSTAFHSAFVEMGTGLRGQKDPNPYNYLPGWDYDTNKHGEKGWIYKGDDGKLHWTQGMPHRPFMYETAQLLRQSAAFVAEGLLKRGGGKK